MAEAEAGDYKADVCYRLLGINPNIYYTPYTRVSYYYAEKQAKPLDVSAGLM